MKSDFINEAKKQLNANTPDIIIELLASQINIAREAEKRIVEEGIVVRDMKGSVIPHPAIKIERNALTEIANLIKNKNRLKK